MAILEWIRDVCVAIPTMCCQNQHNLREEKLKKLSIPISPSLKNKNTKFKNVNLLNNLRYTKLYRATLSNCFNLCKKVFEKNMGAIWTYDACIVPNVFLSFLFYEMQSCFMTPSLPHPKHTIFHLTWRNARHVSLDRKWPYCFHVNFWRMIYSAIKLSIFQLQIPLKCGKLYTCIWRNLVDVQAARGEFIQYFCYLMF
jgi:hypothetical protein